MQTPSPPTGGHYSSICSTCSICNLTFSKQYLPKHIKNIHQQNDSFACEDCDYKTNRKDGLQDHRDARHNNLLLYDCKLCSFSAKTRQLLYIHRKSKHTVTDTTIYTCNTCPFSTKRKYTIEMHEESVHKKNKLYSCPECDFKTFRKSSIGSHIKGKHGNLHFHAVSVIMLQLIRAIYYHTLRQYTEI